MICMMQHNTKDNSKSFGVVGEHSLSHNGIAPIYQKFLFRLVLPYMSIYMCF
jgi:hypothetical protein